MPRAPRADRTPTMKLIYAGTPDFAAVALDALLTAGHEVVTVLTQPDRPAGRGLKLVPSAVKRLALERGLTVAQPVTLKDEGVVAELAATGAEAWVVAAYGLILPETVLRLPPLGCLNIHASLLPRWRGAAPIQRAILAGDRHTGISIMQMDRGLDTGPVLSSATLAIADDDTAQSLHDRLAALGARMIVEVLRDRPAPQPQDDTHATYAAKLDKREAQIDWRQPADVVARRIRAFNPAPGAVTLLDGQPLKLWRAHPVAGAGTPGTVLATGAEGVVVACGEGAVALTEVQRAGGKRVAVAAFLAGMPLPAGTRLGV